VVFIAVGMFFVDSSRLALGASPSFAELSSSALLLIFAFGGYEVIPVPAGEARDPRRAVPFALIMTILAVAIVMTAVQIVAMGTLPGLATSRTPLADASLLFMGAGGAALMTLGAVFSTSGNNMGQALSGSRSMFALAEHGDLPRLFARVHPAFRTPVTAILVTSAVALVLALSGRYATLALASATSRLVVYGATCAATLRLRSPAFATIVKRATFVAPFGPVIPAAAIAVTLSMLAGARREQLLAGGIALAVGAVLFVSAVRSGRSSP
jgi:basic amino acid/polyamine antiporter, APA family